MARTTAVVTTEQQEVVLDATLALIARRGVTRTTAADIAREAGCGRATLYRMFSGGRGEILDTLARREVARTFAVVTGALDAATDLGPALASSLTAAAVHVRQHPAVRTVLADDPHLAVPIIGFGEAEALFRAVHRAVAPHLVRWVPAEEAPWVAEWMARIFLSAALDPDDPLDLTDPAVTRRMIDRFVLPALDRPTDDVTALYATALSTRSTP